MFREDEDIYSIPVKAGKRRYFFDVKTSKDKSDFYLTITESRRQTNYDGSYSFEKRKIHLYKEDFDKFTAGFQEALDFIKNKCFNGEIPIRETNNNEEEF